VGSWALGGTGTENADGTLTNTLSASATGTGGTSFTGFGIYTWASDVNLLIGPVTGSSCVSCHSFTLSPNTLVGVAPSFAPCNTSTYVRVVAGSAGSSLVYLKVSQAAPPCGSQMPPSPTPLLNATQLQIIRAWINNGAKNN
jgi:hypothetical protein